MGLKVNSEDVAGIFNRVLNCAGVLYVEPNFLLQAADTIPNDSNWGLQYGLVNIRAPQGWDLTTGSAAVTIAVVDTGVDYGHPDLASKLVAGYDFVNADTNPQDEMVTVHMLQALQPHPATMGPGWLVFPGERALCQSKC